jgi:hypothetical protein
MRERDVVAWKASNRVSCDFRAKNGATCHFLRSRISIFGGLKNVVTNGGLHGITKIDL